MNPSAYPAVRLCLAFAAGIVLQDCVFPQFDPSYLFYISLPFCAFAGMYIHKGLNTVWLSGMAILLTTIIAGMKATHAHNELTGSKVHFMHTEQPYAIKALVSDKPEQTASGYKFKLKVTTTLSSQAQAQMASGNLQVYLKTTNADSVPKYGDELLVRCSPKCINGALNPDAFDFSQYMHTQNVHFQVFTRPDSVVMIGHGKGNLFWDLAYQMRDRILNTLAKYFTDTADLGVAEALLVGYKGHLPDELQNAYIETGSMHVLAVSGAHVGIIFMGIVLFLKQLRLRGKLWRRAELFIILACIWGFAFLAGMGPSIARATVMFTFYLIAKQFRLDYEGYNVLAASALCLLVYDPFMLFQVSFQLSYLAVLGMMVFYPTLYKLSPILPKWIDFFWKIFLLGIAAQLGTLPLSLMYFGQFPTYFWLSGLVVVPVATIYMFAAVSLIIVDQILPLAAWWLAQPIIWMVKAMNYSIYLMQKLPGALIDGVWLRWWDVCFFGSIVFLMALQFHYPKGWKIVGMSLALLGLSVSSLTKTMIRSSQNEVIVYHTGNTKTLLVDLIDGHQRVSLNQGIVSVKVTDFSAKNHRAALGLDLKDEAVLLSENNNLLPKQTSVSLPFIQFGKRTYAIINSAYQFHHLGKTIPVDALILDQKVRLSPEDAFKLFQPKTVVLCQNLSRKTITIWTEYCVANNIELHAIGRTGAWLNKIS